MWAIMDHNIDLYSIEESIIQMVLSHIKILNTNLMGHRLSGNIKQYRHVLPGDAANTIEELRRLAMEHTAKVFARFHVNERAEAKRIKQLHTAQSAKVNADIEKQAKIDQVQRKQDIAEGCRQVKALLQEIQTNPTIAVAKGKQAVTNIQNLDLNETYLYRSIN